MVKDDPGKWAVSGLDGSFSVSVDAGESSTLVCSSSDTDKSESERTDLQKRLDTIIRKYGNVLHTVTRTR